MFEFRLGEIDGGVCRAEVFYGGKQGHIGVQDAFLYGTFGLLGRKGRGLFRELACLDVQAGGPAIPNGVRTGNAEAQAVVVAVVDERVVVECVLDACAHGRVVARFGLLYADVRLLFAELGCFQREALFFGLLEAVRERPCAAEGGCCRDQEPKKNHYFRIHAV